MDSNENSEKTTDQSELDLVNINISRKRKNPFVQRNLKEEKEKRRQKRARIVIRNISYKCQPDQLREYFEKYGKIIDFNLLKKPDGKLVGCAFIQYETINQAAKAIYKTNSQAFLARPIFVDWALGKNEYEKKKNSNSNLLNTKESEEIKEEQDAAMESVKKEEKNSNISDIDSTIKSKDDSDTEDDSDIESGKEDADEDEDDISVNNESYNDDESDNKDEYDDEDEGEDVDEDEDEDDDKKKIKLDDNENNMKTKKKYSNDLSEGCTIFIKNVPFDATNEDLHKVCRIYGPIYYALINRDKISGYSKGTGFVKFKKKESADMCLAAGDNFILRNTVLQPFEALSRNDVKNANNKEKKVTDSRNLYLAKEGLIMTGSPAAEGVSAADLAKRHKLEQVKTQILKNLNRFVSRNRLSIHNLPLTYDDEKLKNMIIKTTQLKPHECRVMVDNKPSVGFPKGKPKGFGFVSFKTHQDALTALRKLNNNPIVFGNNNRPIVGFSIEDRSVHNVKEKRLKKSKEMNPTFKMKLEKRKEQRKLKRTQKINNKGAEVDNKNMVAKYIKNTKNNKNSLDKNQMVEKNEGEDFVGLTAERGSSLRMRSNKKIYEQATHHNKKLSEIKRKNKKRKEKLQIRLEKKQIDRPKQGKKKIVKDDNFSNLVDKYKKLLDKNDKSIKKSKRTKWYVE